jgi:hypothetical protein
MILELLQLIKDNILPLNFICHLLIFAGGLYVAVHSRLLPNWMLTSLWYIGLGSCINGIAIIFQWTCGPDFMLSYNNIGTATETILNICLAATVFSCFSNTLLKDFKGMKQRKKVSDFEI